MTYNLHHILMDIQPHTITHEHFKLLIKEWLDTHREEYCAFAEELNKRDRTGFQQIFLYAQSIAPAYADAVKSRMADNRDEGFDELEKLLEDADIGMTILRDFQSENPNSIAPAMLAWLYFGNSWELMVSYNEEIIQNKDSGFFNRLMARAMIYFIIRRSIRNEHRTKEDWEQFRKIQKSMGSVVPVTDSAIVEIDEEEPVATADGIKPETTDEKKEPKKRGRKKVRETLDNLIPDNTDRIKGKISEFLKLRSSGNDLAMLYIYLHEDSHIRSCDISTFHDALSEHYPDHKLVGLRGVQKAHQQLTTPMMGGKRMIDMGQDKKSLENIRLHFAA